MVELGADGCGLRSTGVVRAGVWARTAVFTLTVGLAGGDQRRGRGSAKALAEEVEGWQRVRSVLVRQLVLLGSAEDSVG